MSTANTTQTKKISKQQWEISHRLLYFLIFLSGIAALIYELIWVRELNLIFGVSSFAVATVISIFLLGIGLGSYIFGRRAEKTINVIKSYAYLELSIAIFSAISFVVLRYTNVFDAIFFYSFNNLNLYLLSIVRFFIAGVILIVPSIGIGGTIPLVTKYLTVSNRTLGSRFSIIYYCNSLGAFIGIMATGFLLVRYVGMTKTFFIAVLLNVLIFILIQLRKNKKIAPAVFSRDDQETSQSDYNAPRVKEMLVILGITGFIALGYELLWIRALANFGHGTTLSFTAVVGGFLLGFTLGSVYMSRVIDRIKKPFQHFAAYSAIIGMIGAGFIFIFSTLYSTDILSLDSYQRLTAELWIGFGSALILALLMGALFPLGTRLYAGTKDIIGKKIGLVYLINSLGTVAGSLTVGFICIPFLGIRNTAVILIVLPLGIAAYLIIKKITRRGIPAALLMLSAVISAVLLVASGNTFYRSGEGDTELYYAEGLTGTVTVFEYPSGGTTLKRLNIDSQTVAGTYPEGVIDSKLLAHLPLLMIPEPNNALTVGYGSGGTSYSMLLYGVEVYALEIEERVLEASKQFRELNHGIETDPSLHIIVDDARSYLKNIDNTFDAIVTDVTGLKYKSNPYLYTEEYFRVMKDKLTPDGIAAAWTPLSGLSFTDLRTLIASFSSVYPHTTAWMYHKEQPGFLILIGTPDTLRIDVSVLGDRMVQAAADLESIGIYNEYEFGAMLLLGEQDVQKLSQGVPRHTDDLPVLEFTDFEYYGLFNPFENLNLLLGYQRELYDKYFIFNEEQEQKLLQEFARGRELMQHYINEH